MCGNNNINSTQHHVIINNISIVSTNIIIFLSNTLAQQSPTTLILTLVDMLVHNFKEEERTAISEEGIKKKTNNVQLSNFLSVFENLFFSFLFLFFFFFFLIIDF